MQFVVGLLEEQVIDENNPEYENIVNQVKKNTPNNNPMIIGVDPSASPYVDPATLAALSKQAQEFNKKMINKGGS
jgi:hypothetical protein